MSFHEDTKLWVVLLVISSPRIHHYHQFDLLHFQVRCACNSSIQIFLINIDNQKIFFLFFFLSGVQSHTKYINSLPNSNCTLIINIKVEIPCILQTKTLWLLQVLEDNFWVLHWNMSNYTSFMARINTEMRKILLTDRQIIWKFRERERGREMRERERERVWLTKVKENYPMSNPWIKSHQEGQQYIQCTQPSPGPPKHRPEVHHSDL